ncbi:hypothetical protein RJT34_09872 [Clitoria ternatea]|uniref:Uncharacterized protein n=1 Tax=Clitoria ternatea TaxID=43366 RepID=A0AAN9PTI1_CLITE
MIAKLLAPSVALSFHRTLEFVLMLLDASFSLPSFTSDWVERKIYRGWKRQKQKELLKGAWAYRSTPQAGLLWPDAVPD